MELAQLIDELSRPSAFPGQVDRIEVRQTHISAVFLAGELVYKIKKPVRLDFLDFSTLEQREHFCREELRLNARLAGDVYLDVVPVALEHGRPRLEASGEPVEWAVKMRRLPDDATLEHRLGQAAVSRGQIEELAALLADFHKRAERGETISRFGRYEVVAQNVRDNFHHSRRQIGETVSPAVFDRLQAASEAALAAHRELIEARAARGVPCDTHGDLRTDHVYLLSAEAGRPAQTVIIDCIEFNEAYRFADPVCDLAFLVMDLAFIGQAWAAQALAEAYFAATGDHEGRSLLPLYVSYRAAVRAKVEGIKQSEHEVPAEERQRARERAQAYWLLALGELAPPQQRPGLILIGGLPGSGKSTLAAALAEEAAFQVIRSDVVRKELAGVTGAKSAPRAFGTGLYTAEWNDRTYAECLRRAEALLLDGQRVIVDASFREQSRREAFLAAADCRHLPALMLTCEAPPEEIRRRLAARTGDASDADWAVYQAAARAWQPATGPSAARQQTIDTSISRQHSLAAAFALLRAAGLAQEAAGAS